MSLIRRAAVRVLELAESPPTFGSRMASVVSGVALALAILTFSVTTLTSLTRASWFEPSHERLLSRLFIIVIPVAIYLLGVVAFWKERRRIASGILAAGAALITHGIVYLVS